MSARDVIRQAIEATNRHDAEAFARGYSEDAVVHDPQYPEPLRGREAIRDDIETFFRSFPDLHAEVRSVLEDGNTYAFEVALTGTHQGPIPTPDGGEIPATKKRIEQGFGAFGRLGGENRIVEERRYYDLAGLFAQLGISS